VPELDANRRVAESRGRLFLIGPRRFGKSSVRGAAEERLSKGGVDIRAAPPREPEG
jgi:hypothetical protein